MLNLPQKISQNVLDKQYPIIIYESERADDVERSRLLHQGWYIVSESAMNSLEQSLKEPKLFFSAGQHINLHIMLKGNVAN